MGQRNLLSQKDINDLRSHENRLPLVEVCGRRRVLIENHMGIIRYGSEETIIKVSFGSVHVLGDKLKIRKICKEKLIISGVIETVHFLGREYHGTH